MDKEKVVSMCQSQMQDIATRLGKNISYEAKATLIQARSTALLALAIATQDSKEG
ncbi:hypothetical protein [Paenibacillus sp. UASWS1643]|uniref:hypothetical protein n=1 Tax=Paenibacillus sp. UASWS1643 TaxID=2580422 RepID=UPI00168781DA|nr:hypothetical protein [Paenibacillus sp. UASWS1643]